MSTKTTLEVGQKAPDFTLPSQQGGTIELSALQGQWVVLYFYPRDNTPGCTLEAKAFQHNIDEFTEHNAVVLGVSTDNVDSHCKFAEKYSLNFHLLADEDHEVAEKYGVWVQKSMMGRKYMGIQRATFLIDDSGILAEIWPKVSPAGHAKAVLRALQDQEDYT